MDRVRAVHFVPSMVLFGKSQVFGCESGPFRNPGKHAWADLFTIMKCKGVVCPSRAGEDAMRTVNLSLDGPADREECGENPSCLG